MSALGKLATLIVLGPIAVLVLGIGGCEATKAYYDRQVRQMCDMDGGTSVYERMPIAEKMYKELKGQLGGGLAIPHESQHDVGVPVYWRTNSVRIRADNPSVTRTEIFIIRRVDGKVLGMDVRYARTGGDFPFTVSEPSEFTCPTVDADTLLSRKIFYIEGVAK